MESEESGRFSYKGKDNVKLAARALSSRYFAEYIMNRGLKVNLSNQTIMLRDEFWVHDIQDERKDGKEPNAEALGKHLCSYLNQVANDIATGVPLTVKDDKGRVCPLDEEEIRIVTDASEQYKQYIKIRDAKKAAPPKKKRRSQESETKLANVGKAITEAAMKFNMAGKKRPADGDDDDDDHDDYDDAEGVRDEEGDEGDEGGYNDEVQVVSPTTSSSSRSRRGRGQNDFFSDLSKMINRAISASRPAQPTAPAPAVVAVPAVTVPDVLVTDYMAIARKRLNTLPASIAGPCKAVLTLELAKGIADPEQVRDEELQFMAEMIIKGASR